MKMQLEKLKVTGDEEIDPQRFRELVSDHPFLPSEDLREMLRDMVLVHIKGEMEDLEEAPLVGISPCLLIPVLYELIARRYQAGEIAKSEVTVQ